MTALDVGVIIATYGEDKWAQLARERAIPSVREFDVPWIHVHGESLHQARNEGLTRMSREFVVHLDADDELERGYFEEMSKGTADLRAPSVRYVKNNFPGWPYMPKVAGHEHVCKPECLYQGNWLVVGTCARRELLLDVGAWRDFPWSEDWDIWLRCHIAGASIEAVPSAVYRAYVRRDSRNRGATQEERREAHRAIATANNLAPEYVP